MIDNKHFVFIISSYNNEKWYKINLDSITNFENIDNFNEDDIFLKLQRY